MDRANISTIHKFVFSILRNLSLYTGLGAEFSISSDQHAREAIYDNFLEQFILKKVNENESFIRELPVPLFEIKEVLMEMARILLNKSVDLEAIKNESLGEPYEYIPYFNELFTEVALPSEREYYNYMHQQNKVDLNELIILFRKTLKKYAMN